MVEKQFQTNMFSVFYEKCLQSQKFNRNRELIPKLLAQPQRKHVCQLFSLVLGTKSCLETDDLRVLDISEISETCCRLTK